MKFASLFLLTVFMAFSANLSAQAKLEEKANQKVEELNAKLTAINADLGLSPKQMEQANVIFMEGLKAIKKNNKTELATDQKKEEEKTLRKEMNKRIRAEVLSKEQKKALSNKK